MLVSLLPEEKGSFIVGLRAGHCLASRYAFVASEQEVS